MEVLVSVVIPTYKRSDTLSRAIESALNQTYQKIEVIIVDDNEKGSLESKKVQEVLQKYNNRVMYINPEKHINGAVARNYGIKKANGDYIAFLDDDDEWKEDKIKKQLDYLKEKDVDGVSCLYEIIKNNKLIRKCKPYNAENLHLRVLSREVAVYTSTLLLKKNVLVKIGGFNEELLRHQDLQLLLDFLYENKIEVLNEELVKIHSDSAINRQNSDGLIKIKEKFFDICSKHLEIYSKKEQKKILSSHCFEIIFLAMKEKRLNIVIKYLIKIGLSLDSYRILYRRWIARK